MATHFIDDRRVACDITPAAGFIGTTEQDWKYDGLSRQTECVDNNDSGTADDVTCTYAFDSLSRTVEETQQVGASGVTRVVSCSYDIATAGAEGACSSTTYPDGRQVDSTFDRLDRLVDRTDNGQAAAIGTYEYLGAYRVATLTYQNDTRLTHIGQDSGSNADVGFDGDRRIVDHRWESFTGGDTTPGDDTLLIGFGHEFASGDPAYDRMNNKLIEDKQHAADLSEVYAYDSAYRITEFDRGTLNSAKDAVSTATTLSGALQSHRWELDGVHNWVENVHTTQGGTAQTENRTHSDFNETYQVTGTPYAGAPTRTDQHDTNGNLTDDGTLTYEWDAKNRLREVTLKSSGNTIAAYTYDCHGRRFEKVVTNGGVSGSVPNGHRCPTFHAGTTPSLLLNRPRRRSQGTRASRLFLTHLIKASVL